MIWADLQMAAACSFGLEAALSRTKGLLLICGPTGVGKTTSLAALTGRLTVDGRMPVVVLADEDAPTPTLTSNAAIVVGDIRSAESAMRAFQLAAQTLVLGVLRSGRSYGVLSRLEQMGISRSEFLAAAPFVMTQKLCRQLCRHCRVPVPIQTVLMPSFPLTPSELLPFEGYVYDARGCSACRDGFSGVLPIGEVLRVKVEESSESEVVWERLGSIRTSGIVAAAAGLTTLSELERVVDQ
jgi:type IV pilus assembly protein PilB